MSTNLTLEQANELFKKMEMAVAVVAEPEQADTNADLDSMAKAAFSEIEAKVENEKGAEIKDQVRKEEKGKYLGSLRTVLKRHFGVDEKEFAEMNMDDMVKYAKGKIETNKTEADSDWAKRYEDLQKDLDAKDNEWQQKYNTREAELMDQFHSRDMKERILSIVTGVPRVGGDPQRQADAIYQELRGKYELKINDNKEVELWDKANPEKKVFDGKNVMTDKYVVEKYLTDIGVRATDTRHIKPSDVEKGEAKNVGIGVGQAETTDALDFFKGVLEAK